MPAWPMARAVSASGPGNGWTTPTCSTAKPSPPSPPPTSARPWRAVQCRCSAPASAITSPWVAPPGPRPGRWASTTAAAPAPTAPTRFRGCAPLTARPAPTTATRPARRPGPATARWPPAPMGPTAPAAARPTAAIGAWNPSCWGARTPARPTPLAITPPVGWCRMGAFPPRAAARQRAQMAPSQVAITTAVSWVPSATAARATARTPGPT